MFSYYGSKGKIIKRYPTPMYENVIEPFCGSAKYALTYNEKNIILNDSYDVIAGIWKYLINVSEDQIQRLPNLNLGDNLKDIKGLTKEERDLLGFMVSMGVAMPHNTYTGWAAEGGEIARRKKFIIKNLEKIRHWKVFCRSYEDLPDIEATWFIDPPYQHGGNRYKKNSIDYKKLADWCRSRKGQVIVCENTKADWMPFKPLIEIRGQVHRTTEAVWVNENL